jgi:hypothetical protein
MEMPWLRLVGLSRDAGLTDKDAEELRKALPGTFMQQRYRR